MTSGWLVGNPETGHMDTDASPTKTAVLKTQRNPEQEHFWQLCFGKLAVLRVSLFPNRGNESLQSLVINFEII